MQLRRQLPGAAAKIDDPAGGASRDQRDQIMKGLLALAAKTLVLRGVPGVTYGHVASGETDGAVVNIGRQDSVAPVRSRAWAGHAPDLRCLRA